MRWIVGEKKLECKILSERDFITIFRNKSCKKITISLVKSYNSNPPPSVCVSQKPSSYMRVVNWEILSEGGGNLLFLTHFLALSANCAKNRVCYRQDRAIDVRKKTNTKTISEFREKWSDSWGRPNFWKFLIFVS